MLVDLSTWKTNYRKKKNMYEISSPPTSLVLSCIGEMHYVQRLHGDTAVYNYENVITTRNKGN